MITRLWPALLVLTTLLSFTQTAMGSSSSDARYVTYQNAEGQTVYLNDNRRPSLYTGNFGDCLGSSLVNVTRFDAAYYKDNMTVLFHLAGTSALQNESLVMFIGVYAYGESRFDLTFNPCHANIESLCPLNANVPITANGIIPIAESDVSTIPNLAYAIPDFEGQAILRLFANSTQSEIGCYSAVVTNGHSFAQPASVGSVLGIFTFVAMAASFATAIYGEAVPTMRLHYAHSLSVGVVFAVFQHIFFTGALSMNWPSVLVAWWHNFAWSGGMIYTQSMQNSIDRLIGTNIGNTSQVGAAPSDSTNDDVGGGYDISQIYKRMLGRAFETPANHPLRRDLAPEIYGSEYSVAIARRELLDTNARQRLFERALEARDVLANKTDGYRWYGQPIGPNMPLPGNYSGFAGTLAEENIGVSNAFMTGFLWFLILLVLLVAAIVAFKWILEGLAHFHKIKEDRLKFFRDHWIGYTVLVALRTCFLGFFLMMFLTIFEFTFQSSAGVKIVAAIVFFIFVLGIPGAAAYACYYKKHFANNGPHNPAEHKKLLGVIPWATKKPEGASTIEVTQIQQSEKKDSHRPFWRRARSGDLPVEGADVVDNIHDNEDYTVKFGWLASRFRRTRWWFFTVWLFYEFVRAIFYAGASGYPLAQVFGLLIVEFIAFGYIVWARPFEGRRLNVIVVYCLGFSKVASVALSAAFDVHFNLPRITTTVVGIVVIVIQGLLTIITMIAIAVGAISSYMSISRNQEDFRPRKWHGLREKYFDHLDRVANDLPREPKPKKKSKQDLAEEPAAEQVGFEVKGMKRLAKIEDEDEEFVSEMRGQDANTSHVTLSERATSPPNVPGSVAAGQRSGTTTPRARSRPASLQSTSQSNLPYGARPHRQSWSTRDFRAQIEPEGDDVERRSTSMDISVAALATDDYDDAVPVGQQAGRSRTSSLRSKRRSNPIANPQASTSAENDLDFAPPLPKAGRSRTSSLRSKRKSNPTVNPQASTDSLRIGGEVSSRDTIGDVPPPPITRPRSGSWRGSRPTTPGYISGEESDDNDLHYGYQRGSKYLPMMTPAQEKEEWGANLTPKQTHEH